MSAGKKKRITIRDVAVKAKVSVATVGRVIGGYGVVSPSTVKKVNEVAKVLGYLPDGIAQSLKIKSTHTLGVIVANICNPFFGTIVRAAEDEAEKNKYNVVVCNTDENIEKEILYAKTLLTKKVDGLIVASAYFEGVGHSQKLRSLYGDFIPTVLIDRKLPRLQVPLITTDNFDAAYNATKYLVQEGHRRIAVISGLTRLSSVGERIEGYKKALLDAGIPVDESLIIDCGNVLTRGGYDAAVELLARPEGKPTAIIPLNSLLTEGVLKRISEVGVRIPEDVSIIGWDDFELATVLRPPLTVVHQDAYAIGKAAAQIMIAHLEDRLDDVAFSKSTVTLDCEFRQRQSVRSLRTLS